MEKRINRLLNSGYRRELWRNSQLMIRKISKVLPISSISVMGSFTTKKKRPGDVDFIVMLKTKGAKKKAKWSVDFVIVPDNKHGEYIFEDTKKWMKQKYGSKKSAIIPLKIGAGKRI
ncbi:MAG: hypothetical protein KGH71_01535 [Candidatus Micrarchaeota archaeon]|nr:hypothetical protein [Candidatus Micrarchaeota archaeon]